MEEFVPILVVIGLIISLGNCVKMATAGQWSKVGTLLVMYLIGTLVTVLFATSDVGKTFVLSGYVLGDLDIASLILVGVFLSGTAGTVYDALPLNTPTLGSTSPLE